MKWIEIWIYKLYEFYIYIKYYIGIQLLTLNEINWRFESVSVILIPSNCIHVVVSNVSLIWSWSHLGATTCSSVHRWPLAIWSLNVSSSRISSILLVCSIISAHLVITCLVIISVTAINCVLILVCKFTTWVYHGAHFSYVITYTNIGLWYLCLNLLVLFLNPSYFGLKLANLLVHNWVSSQISLWSVLSLRACRRRAPLFLVRRFHLSSFNLKLIEYFFLWSDLILLISDLQLHLFDGLLPIHQPFI